jgi:cbb3-type cytochrome oxidase maturation protein
MTIIYILLPIALLLGLGFLVAFIIMSAHGQYDDLDTPAYRILIDDEGRKSKCPQTKP